VLSDLKIINGAVAKDAPPEFLPTLEQFNYINMHRWRSHRRGQQICHIAIKAAAELCDMRSVG